MDLSHILIKPTQHNRYSERGISLLEIVLVLAMLSVLSSYLLPSYHTYIQRGYRLAAIAAVYRAAQFAEQVLAESGATTDGRILVLPNDLARSPPQGAAIYQLEVHQEEAGIGGYKIVAQPTEAGPMSTDVCGSFGLDSRGRRSNQSRAESTSELIAACWQGRGK